MEWNDEESDDEMECGDKYAEFNNGVTAKDI